MNSTGWLLVLVGFAGSLVAQTRPVAQQTTGTARIRGMVVDAAAGTPLRRASLRLRRPSTRESWTAVTDGNGSFEFPSLPSGRFTITASKGGYVNVETPADQAPSIQLADGQTLDLPPLRVPRGGVITGSIRDQYGDPASELAVEAYRAEYMQGARRLISVRSGQTNDIGQYRIYGLQPGTYYVTASARGEDGSPLQIMDPGTETVPGAAGLSPTFYPGTATAADAQRIQVAAGTESTTAGHSMSGRVNIEGAPPNAQALGSLRMAAMEPIGGTSATLLAAHTSVGNDGAFTIAGLIGRRIIRLSGLPRGWALKAVRVRGADITDDGLEISDNVDDVEIVVTATPTQLTGVLTDSTGQLVADASVIIFPEARERRGGPLNRFVTSARVDGNGAFTVQALPPGRYFAIAVPVLAEGEWAEPAYLEAVEARATRFTLSEGESKQIGLRLDSR